MVNKMVLRTGEAGSSITGCSIQGKYQTCKGCPFEHLPDACRINRVQHNATVWSDDI